METKFNFNSQICTSKVQSEHLLALGVKPETADMRGVEGIEHTPTYAWSLHRLLSLIPKEFEANVVPMYGRNYRKWVCFNMNFDYNIIYLDGNQEDFVGFYEGNVYDKIISCIEWLIKKGYFNKEYLCKR